MSGAATPRAFGHADAMTMVADINEALDLEPTGPGVLRARSLRDIGEGNVVFGGQFLAQMVVAAASADPAKTGTYVSAVLGRPAVREHPVDFEVEAMHGGRSFATVCITIRQDGKLCARGVSLLSAEEPDLIRHQLPMPDVDPPEACQPFDGSLVGEEATRKGGREMRVVGGFHPGDPDEVRDAVLRVWARGPNLDGDPVKSQGFIALVSSGPNISMAMLPHKGFGTMMAHETVSTGIMTHTVTFHEAVDAREWMLFDHVSPAAGHGRSYARGDVFSSDGRLVASFAQDAMIRPFPVDPAVAKGGRTVL
jgi:acyl-CoA thioesterase